MMLYQLDRELDRAQVIDDQAAVPARLAAAVEGVRKEALVAPGPGGGWSAFQVVLHMRDAALVYAARFRWMVFDDRPVLPNYDEDAWVAAAWDEDAWVAAAWDEPADLPAILDEVAASRADLVRVLSRLPEEAWARTGRHEVLGTVVLEPYVRHQLAHEEGHLYQLGEALGRAWKPYRGTRKSGNNPPEANPSSP